MLLVFLQPAIGHAEDALPLHERPRLVVKDFAGRSFDLSQLRGKWALVNFFATWCPGCKTELPRLTEIQAQAALKNLQIIALSPEPSRKRNEVKNFVKDYPFPAGLLADSSKNDFGTPRVLPVTYLIDPNGQIEKVYLPEDGRPMVSEIESVIAHFHDPGQPSIKPSGGRS